MALVMRPSLLGCSKNKSTPDYSQALSFSGLIDKGYLWKMLYLLRSTQYIGHQEVPTDVSAQPYQKF